MRSGRARGARHALLILLLLWCASSTACGRGLLRPEYEYEEEIYLALDGSATLNINASIPALVALRGADLDPNPRARIDRGRVRALFGDAGRDVSVSLSRRDGRRFVHISVDVDDVRQASQLAPFAWSTYRFAREGDLFEFNQIIGPPADRDIGDVSWTGEELVLFKMHLPSEIVFHNAPSGTVERGNILEWEQPLAERLAGRPLQLEVHLETESILFTTLMLFGATIVAAGMAFALTVWWIARRGRDLDMAESRS